MINVPLEPFFVWIMLFLRAGFILGFFPLIGERFVPVRVRLLLAAVVSIALTPLAPLNASMFPSDTFGFLAMVASEALLGFGVGLVGRILFATVQFSGQLAGEQMGFGLVNAIDPTGSHQISVIAEMLYLGSILVFLMADLHHVFLQAILSSYGVLPPGTAMMTQGVNGFMVGMGSALFSFSLQFAMPVIVIVFAINVGLGMIARAVPQVNVFLESFPLRILAGVAVLMVSLGFTIGMWQRMFGDMDRLLGQLIASMKG